MAGYEVAPVSITPLNLGATLSTAAALKNAQTNNALAQIKIEAAKQKIAHDKAVEDAVNGMFGGTQPAASGGIATAPSLDTTALPPPSADQGAPVAGDWTPATDNAMAAQPSASPAATGAGSSSINLDSPSVRRLLLLDSTKGSAIIGGISKANADQRAVIKARNEAETKVLMVVQNAPADQREAYYQKALGEAKRMGLPTDNAPAHYDSDWVNFQIHQGMTVDQILTENKPTKPTSVAPGSTLVDANGKPIYTAPERAQKPQVMRPGETLVGTDGKAIFTAPADDGSNQVVKSTDMSGNTVITTVNKKTGKVVSSQTLSANPLSSGGDVSNTHGDAYLQTLPKPMATLVQKLAHGEMQFPSGFALRSPYWQNVLTMVGQYDPNFNGFDYQSRFKTRQYFTSGQGAQNITSFNTLIGHLGTLADKVDALRNGSIPALNYVENAASSATGRPQVQGVRTAVNAVASEAMKAFRGAGGGSEREIQEWRDSFPVNGSPAQQYESLQTLMGLLHSRIDALGEMYNKGMGTTAQGIHLLSDHARQALQSLESRAGKVLGVPPDASMSEVPTTAPATAPVAQTAAPATVVPSPGQPAAPTNALAAPAPALTPAAGTPAPNALATPSPQPAASAMPKMGVMQGQVHLDPSIAPKVSGSARPLAPGEYIMNPSGSWSSEITDTIQKGDYPDFMGGKPTVIPTVWVVDGKPTHVTTDEAVRLAKQSGLTFRTFPTNAAAEAYSQQREAAWQQVPMNDIRAQAAKTEPLWTSDKGSSPQKAAPSALPPAPRDAAARTVGQVYVSPTGKKGRWTGQGWELVP